VNQLRTTACFVTALLVLTVLAQGAPAAASGISVEGTLQGTSTWTPDLSVFGCTVVGPASSWAVSGTFEATFLGTGTYSGTLFRTAPAVCSSVPFSPSPPFPVNGSLSFTGRGGDFVADVLAGSSGYSVDLVHSSDYGFSLDLAITSGTRRFSPISGTLTLLYGTTFTTFFGCPCAPADFGTLSGSLTPREPS
jgi:hypothetical protein